MKNTLKILLIACIPILFFISCEDKPLPFEPKNDINGSRSLSKRDAEKSVFFVGKRALKIIKQTEDKIDKASDKTDVALDKYDGIDLTTVYAKIVDAKAKLLEAQTFYDNGDFGDAIISAKEAKELAEEAIELLEDILDALEDDDENDDDCNAEQAAKFMEQAQEKIAKANDKVAAVTEPVDLTDVNLTIVAAKNSLALAQIAFDAADYPEACAKAKAAKELAGEALDMLEDILDALEDDDENGNEKITICHKGHNITISYNALEEHLNHGDSVGECDD